MQFQIHRLVKIWIHVTADVCHAQWPDKPRMVSHYKINMLIHIFLLVHTYTVCLHLEQAFKTLFEGMKLDSDVLEETFA